jgi:hypothetical protein
MLAELAAVLACFPTELLPIVDEYAKELPHRWRSIRNETYPLVTIAENRLSSAGTNYSCQVVSTQSIITGPNRWRIQVDFDPNRVFSWIWTGVTGVGVDHGVDPDMLTVQRFQCPQIGQAAAGRIHIRYPRRHAKLCLKIQPNEYKMKRQFRCTLDFDVDVGGQSLQVSDPADLDFRLTLQLPPNPAGDWRPVVVFGGCVTATILPLA